MSVELIRPAEIAGQFREGVRSLADDVRDLGNDMFPCHAQTNLVLAITSFPEQCFSVDFPSSATYIKRHGDLPGAAA
jgi:hypothetical protein